MPPRHVPNALVESIREGRCVAFIGAGFVAPTVPGWRETLDKLSAAITDPGKKDDIQRWLHGAKSSQDFEGLAEVIKSALGPRIFETKLASIQNQKPSPAIQSRLDFLDEVPFHAVLTTNFDSLISGELPGPSTYAKVLTAPRHAWWQDYYWDNPSQDGPVRVQLHGHFKAGRAKKLVFSTRDYRRLLFETPSYRAFLHTLFATHTVLYMGFSFTDAYVNQVRSEVLAMLGLGKPSVRGQDFAIMDDVPDVAVQHFKASEGLEILNYKKKRSGPRKYIGFDEWLQAIRMRASPEQTLSELVHNQRILWLDPQPSNNEHGFKILGEKADELTKVTSVDEALDKLRANTPSLHASRATRPYDLVISHFGWQPGGQSNCERLLEEMRAKGLRAPVVVFAGAKHRTRNRRIALELGALAYADTWGELFQTIEELLRDSKCARR